MKKITAVFFFMMFVGFLLAQKTTIPKFPITLFEKSRGTQTPTYFEIIEWWKNLDQKSEFVKMLTMGMTDAGFPLRSEEHTSELQSQSNLVCRLLLEKKKKS